MVIDAFWDLNRVAVIQTDFSENVSFPSSGILELIEYHICLTVESMLTSPFIQGYYLRLKTVSILDAFWVFVSYRSSPNRRFGERIFSISILSQRK
jgi:hypothetical protein